MTMLLVQEEGIGSSVINMNNVDVVTKSQGYITFWLSGLKAPIRYKTPMSVDELFCILYSENPIIKVG